jgi:hypothetical protein
LKHAESNVRIFNKKKGEKRDGIALNGSYHGWIIVLALSKKRKEKQCDNTTCF